MRAVYIGIGIALAILVGVFVGFNWWQNRTVQQAYATPTPGTTPTPKPVQLENGENIGKKFVTTKYPDTPTGGRGQTVDGIECGAQEYATLHVHTHLALFYNGKQMQIPEYIGFAPNLAGGCLYWIHTHDGSGIIHIEAPDISPPQGGPYTLGMLFDIWGQPLERDGVAGLIGPVTVYLNGTKYDGDMRAIPLGAHQQIVIEVGTPVVPPPNYAFPPGV
ncbi:MAG TPA: hypothetical protein VMU38_08110 [Candidatus Binatia bacterium]|nr:hypothetical protein [Candidatus Binatia bacterium]